MVCMPLEGTPCDRFVTVFVILVVVPDDGNSTDPPSVSGNTEISTSE